MSQFYKTNSLVNIQEEVQQVYQKMIEHQKNGEYQDAERCRLQWQHRKQELKNKQIQEMQMRHNRQRNQLTDNMNEELSKLNDVWSAKMNEFHRKNEQNINNLLLKHQDQLKKLEEDLSLQLSTKVKESPQLLNLRKMEEHMAKQKNYTQAHRVQQKIKKVFTQEQQIWMEKRSQKINQGLTNLRNKQTAQLTNLRQRIKTNEQDFTKEHHFQGLRIKQRYQNVMKDLKTQQQRQILSFKGEFRTLGGGSPTSSPNGKSKNSTLKA